MWGGCVCVDDVAREWHIESQFPLMPWSSQARGFFSGAFTPENRENRDMVRVYYNDENFERLERAKKMAANSDYSPIQISLAYCLNLSFPVLPVVGPLTLSEMDSSIGAAALELSNVEMQWLNLETDGDPL